MGWMPDPAPAFQLGHHPHHAEHRLYPRRHPHDGGKGPTPTSPSSALRKPALGAGQQTTGPRRDRRDQENPPGDLRPYESTATGSVTDTIAGKSLLDNPRFFYSWQFRPLLLGLWFATADLVAHGRPCIAACCWNCCACSPVLRVRALLLVRLVLMLLMMYLGAGVPGAAPVGHPFAGRDFIVKATLLSASGAAPICSPSGARTAAIHSPIAT